MNEVVKKASKTQALASDPASSAFVSANAGTGKTKVLTDRVLRLLLEGAVADGILCVTYTRAAAAEMRNRISRQLARWAVVSTADLRDELAERGMANPSQDVLARARRLFAEILDNDQGPRVETVHSFCQSILGRFPIEAGIAPHTSLADEAEQESLRAAARAAVMRTSDPDINRAVMRLAEQINEDQLRDVLASFVQNETRLGAADLGDRLEAHFTDHLGLGEAGNLDDQFAAAITMIDLEGLRAVAQALRESGVKSHIGRSAQMDAWLAEDDLGRVEKIDLLVDALFSAGQPRSLLSNKDIREVFPACDDVQRQIQAVLDPHMMARAEQRCREFTVALYRFGMAFQQEYTMLKRAQGLLDYDDLIAVTNRLLEQSDAAQWVAWKLDNGIQHMLIDEAQDTSPAQWQLLNRLSEEFFDDQPESGKEGPARTLFAVGDFKQSIFSFQGADPRVMSASRARFADRARARERLFREISMSVSFRSSLPVLRLVNAAIKDREGIEDFAIHEVTDTGKGGFVELLPVIEVDETPASLEAFTPPEIASATGASALSAQVIAGMISDWIGTRQLADGRMMTAGDVMILLRKRGSYFEQLLAALRRAGVPVAGADRMRLESQIEIQDLLALGDVIVLPEDDLQLAAVLKSPLFEMDEQTLFDLATGRGNSTLYAAVMRHLGSDSKIGKIADRLEVICRSADRMSVYALYSLVLDTGGRAAFRGRLGKAVDESLDHFLTLAQNFGHAGGGSLTEFLTTIRATGGEIKRDLETEGLDAVRIMTIHGAKGLEAPVVFLPDMLAARVPSDPLCKDEDSGFVYWAQGYAWRPDFLTKAKEPAKQRRHEEDMRLLYVALTRAREGLVIGGWRSPARNPNDSDYMLLRKCLGDMDDVVTQDDGRLVLHHVGEMPPADDEGDVPPARKTETAIPQWLSRKAPAEPRLSRPIRPSEVGSDQLAPRPSAASASVNKARLIGQAAHRLFEILPAVSPDRRAAAARTVIGQYADLRQDEAERIINDVIKAMADPSLARLFAPDALAEVPINGVVEGVGGVAGQIDRLQIDHGSVLFADFKTGIRPEGDAPQSYQRQMALYAALLAQIYPGLEINGWLVWTESGKVDAFTMEKCESILELIRVNS